MLYKNPIQLLHGQLVKAHCAFSLLFLCKEHLHKHKHTHTSSAAGLLLKAPVCTVIQIQLVNIKLKCFLVSVVTKDVTL